MASRGTEIHALQEKLRVFAEVAYEAALIERKSHKELANKLNSNYATLKSAWREGRLSNELIEECVRFGRFEGQRHYFIDPDINPRLRSNSMANYPGRDSVEAFRALLLRTLQVSSASTRISGLPKIRNRNVAWFQIDDAGQARTQGAVSDLFLVVGLETAEYDDLFVGITEVRIRITFQQDSGARASRLAGSEAPLDLSGAYLVAKPAAMLPEWRLSTLDGVLEGDFVTSEQPLMEVAGLRLGEEFTAALSFKPSRALQVVGKLSDPLSLVKRRIIGALFVNSLEEEPDRDGWVTLGVQNMKLVRGDQVVI